MSGPDLAWINEANAALTRQTSQRLPQFSADPEKARLARATARFELLEGGPIRELPSAIQRSTTASIANFGSASAILNEAGGPQQCAQKMSNGLLWAARMPLTARLMPHGMVQQAAGSDEPGCEVRIVRYLTVVEAEDALQYHYNQAIRAGLATEYFSGTQALLRAKGDDEALMVEASSGPNGLQTITLVYWRK
ncbi:MAG: hypothetical protein AAF494_10575 [Pseudomonadota bacterium]